VTYPYRGVNGARRRERDEGRQPSEVRATQAGKCADTGAAIAPGDIIQRLADGRVVLIQSFTRSRP
jgi:hypothetical protein